MITYREKFLSNYPNDIFVTVDSLIKFQPNVDGTSGYHKHVLFSFEKICMDYDLHDAFRHDLEVYSKEMSPKQAEQKATKNWEDSWKNIEKYLHDHYGIPVEKKASLK